VDTEVDANWGQLETEAGKSGNEITAYPSVELAVEAMKMGAIDYLIKPVEPDNLETLIRETLPKGKGGHQENEGLLLF